METKPETKLESESVKRLGELKMTDALEKLVSLQIAVWPQHEKFLRKSLEERSERLRTTTDAIAETIYQMIAPDLEEYAKSYQWVCLKMNKEALNFMRTGQYRYSKFSEVRDQVYGNSTYMTAYIQGLLLSQLYWSNHSHVIDTYLHHFLADLPPHSKLLEIGPGHGLFCAFAARSENIASVEAWDISPSSLQVAQENLEKLGLAERVTLKARNVVDPISEKNRPLFDAIVLSEVLEHVEDPKSVLIGIQQYLAPHGKIFINVPINSPAIDHIYLLKSPEEAQELVESAQLHLEKLESFPVTGYTEEEARKQKLSISCVLLASKIKS
jgi:2-polyprenyl-3-methyl-5-hydroxy-6-metoxy-1,4-benzoquinol methylase